MKLLLILFCNIVMISACLSNQKLDKFNTNSKEGEKELVVLEVIQVSSYTYIKGKTDNKENWFAVPKMELKIGEKYYYSGGTQMAKFTSKELNRTFDSIIFLEFISANSTANNPQNPNHSAEILNKMQGSKGKVEKKETIKLLKTEGGTTIAELFDNPKAFDGKVIKIKAQVTKFSESIMSKNWIHLQDGTEAKGKYDLTVTSGSLQFKVGDIVTLEGKIALNKDFGAGYLYDVILEDATQK